MKLFGLFGSGPSDNKLFRRHYDDDIIGMNCDNSPKYVRILTQKNPNAAFPNIEHFRTNQSVHVIAFKGTSACSVSILLALDHNTFTIPTTLFHIQRAIKSRKLCRIPNCHHIIHIAGHKRIT